MKKSAAIANTEQFTISFRDTTIKNTNEREHYHDAYELDYFIQADIEIFIKDTKYTIKDGDVLLINEYDIHRIVYNQNTHYQRYVINFKRNYLEDLFQVLEIEGLLAKIENNEYKKISLNLNQRSEMQSLFDKIKELSNQHKPNQQNQMGNIKSAKMQQALIKSNLLMLLEYYHKLNKDINPPEKNDKKEIHVQKIITYINNNYMNQIDLELLENNFYLNKYYISHIFKEITGFSVIEYIQHQRIINAQKMLNNTDREIANICYDCGFNNLQHFYRVFKKISGTTPKNYRLQ